MSDEATSTARITIFVWIGVIAITVLSGMYLSTKIFTAPVSAECLVTEIQNSELSELSFGYLGDDGCYSGLMWIYNFKKEKVKSLSSSMARNLMVKCK